MGRSPWNAITSGVGRPVSSSVGSFGLAAWNDGDGELNAASRSVTSIAVPARSATIFHRRAARDRRFLLARSESCPECARGEAIASNVAAMRPSLDMRRMMRSLPP